MSPGSKAAERYFDGGGVLLEVLFGAEQFGGIDVLLKPTLLHKQDQLVAVWNIAD
jgi:hypothetical protein